MKNIVFMGTPDFAVGTLEALLASEYTVSAVFTQPDKPKGRKGELTPSPVKQCAIAHGIPVYQPKRIRDPENMVFLRNLEPDVIVVVAFGQIIPKEILELPPCGCINVHGSLLPKYRGAAPIQWSIIDGETHTGVTTMYMDEGVDTGDILLQEATPISPEETGGSLFERLSAMGAQLLIRTLHGLEDQSITPIHQPAESPTPYAGMLTRKDGEVDWSKDAASIDCRIRGLLPWPGAYTLLDGKQLKIWSVGVSADAQDDPSMEAGMPGTVVAADDTGLLVKTGHGFVRIREMQLEGKKRMTADAFLRGCRITPGTRLGQ